MRYYAQYNENGTLFAIGIGYGGTEISEEQYNTLLKEIRQKAEYVERVYIGEFTITDVPAEWREEVQARVDELISEQGAFEEQDISDEEFVNMLEEVL